MKNQFWHGIPGALGKWPGRSVALARQALAPPVVLQRRCALLPPWAVRLVSREAVKLLDLR